MEPVPLREEEVPSVSRWGRRALKPPGELETTRPTDGGPLRVLLACDHLDHGNALHGVGRYVIKIIHAVSERDDGERGRTKASRGRSSDLVLRRWSMVAERLLQPILRILAVPRETIPPDLLRTSG